MAVARSTHALAQSAVFGDVSRKIHSLAIRGLRNPDAAT
jgi:hypothetical protein